jgi:hypothetical protein
MCASLPRTRALANACVVLPASQLVGRFGLVPPRFRTRTGGYVNENGAEKIPFNRNVRQVPKGAEHVSEPPVEKVAQQLLARSTKPSDAGAAFNMMATAWIQYDVHDWMCAPVLTRAGRPHASRDATLLALTPTSQPAYRPTRPPTLKTHAGTTSSSWASPRAVCQTARSTDARSQSSASTKTWKGPSSSRGRTSPSRACGTTSTRARPGGMPLCSTAAQAGKCCARRRGRCPRRRWGCRCGR